MMTRMSSAFAVIQVTRPVTRCNNHAWQKALKRVDINDFRWHDLRHTWASWHVQNGTPLHELQQLGGWSNYETVLRYAHLSRPSVYVDPVFRQH